MDGLLFGRMRRGRAAVAVAVVGVLAGVLVGCRDNEARPERAPLHVGDGDFTTSLAYEGDTVLTFADVDLCINSDETAELLSLTAIHATEGAKVSDFDVVTVPTGVFAEDARPLDQNSSWVSHERTVEAKCVDEGRPYLAIEVSKRVPRAEFPSFLLTYRAGGEEYEEPVELPVAVCSDLKSCDPPQP